MFAIAPLAAALMTWAAAPDPRASDRHFPFVEFRGRSSVALVGWCRYPAGAPVCVLAVEDGARVRLSEAVQAIEQRADWRPDLLGQALEVRLRFTLHRSGDFAEALDASDFLRFTGAMIETPRFEVGLADWPASVLSGGVGPMRPTRPADIAATCVARADRWLGPCLVEGEGAEPAALLAARQVVANLRLADVPADGSAVRVTVAIRPEPPTAGEPVYVPPTYVRWPPPGALESWYPQRGLQADVSARVAFDCVVSGHDERLESCVMATNSAPGFGFSSASMRVVRAMAVSPATLDGRPIRAAVRTPVQWVVGG